MLKLLEVFGVPQGPENEPDMLASVDVTRNTEAERAVLLADVQALYGSECSYFWHDCGHIENRPCTRQPTE